MTGSTADALHPDTVATGLTSVGGYPYSGGTALFNASTDAIGRVNSRANPRKIVVALTDGENNRGPDTLESTISAANTAGVPIYSVGVGIDAASTSVAANDLRALSERTGATATFVNGLDLVGLYTGLQTAIRFETTLTAGQDLTVGQVANLTLTLPGATPASRAVTINR